MHEISCLGEKLLASVEGKSVPRRNFVTLHKLRLSNFTINIQLHDTWCSKGPALFPCSQTFLIQRILKFVCVSSSPSSWFYYINMKYGNETTKLFSYMLFLN